MTMGAARSFAAAGLAGLLLAGCGGDAPGPAARDSQTGGPAAAAPGPATTQGTAAPEQAQTPRAREGQPPEPSRPRRRASKRERREPNGAARQVLLALTPNNEDAGGSPQPPDPASRKLWALVERRLGRSGAAAATEQAAPTPEALRRLLRKAQQQGG
jgi:hypothetical protein